MTQISIPIRFIVTFAAIKDGEIVDLDFQVNAPVETHIPLPGDEVLIPEAKATAKGFTSTVFTVTKRRFLYDGVIGVAGAATLYLSQD
jgi:hypothetical protein